MRTITAGLVFAALGTVGCSSANPFAKASTPSPIMQAKQPPAPSWNTAQGRPQLPPLNGINANTTTPGSTNPAAMTPAGNPTGLPGMPGSSLTQTGAMNHSGLSIPGNGSTVTPANYTPPIAPPPAMTNSIAPPPAGLATGMNTSNIRLPDVPRTNMPVVAPPANGVVLPQPVAPSMDVPAAPTLAPSMTMPPQSNAAVTPAMPISAPPAPTPLPPIKARPTE